MRITSGTARAKGQTEAKVLFRHALKNAAVPIVTIIGIGIALVIGGAVVTETVFNLPGLGRLVVDAILRRDYPIIQGLILVFSSVYILINLLVDILYTLLDPRIRYLVLASNRLSPSGSRRPRPGGVPSRLGMCWRCWLLRSSARSCCARCFRR